MVAWYIMGIVYSARVGHTDFVDYYETIYFLKICSWNNVNVDEMYGTRYTRIMYTCFTYMYYWR
jgi:hypothetical protein